jgi:hypothetical protein
MARSVNHHLRCEHLEERATPADVGCAAAAAEGAAATEGEVMAPGEAFTGEDIATGVLCGHRVAMDEDGTVIAVTPPETIDPVVPDTQEVVIPSAPAEFNFPDEVIPPLRFKLTTVTEAAATYVHEETHPAGRRITEGALTWRVDALLAVDPVDVVKLILGSMGEACQAA